MSITLGISSCLLGEKVRCDGGHKKSDYVVNLLCDYFDFMPVCPEVDIGLGIPRPAIRVYGDKRNPRLVDAKNETIDYTDKMRHYSEQKVAEFDSVSGFILKSKSPTCGMERVKVYQGKGIQPKLGRGLFAEKLMSRYPLLPVEEEGRLNDYKLRENFIERVFIYHRWQRLVKNGLTAQSLIQFHTEHKLTLMAHHEVTYRNLGKKMANLKGANLSEFAEHYIDIFMQAMKKIATNKKHANVLMHLLGYFKKELSHDDKAELLHTIDEYRNYRLPLVVPVTLIKHYLRKYPDDYLTHQRYLFPYPEELMLRNHI